MARQCEVCGKGPQMGNSVTIRGKAKYLGGVGTKVTGITRRQFKPNLQSVHVTIGRGTNKTLLVCTQCLRSGAVRKTVKRAPFKLSKSETAKPAK
ncbi:MAG TPA: 50S ribosomal protein L28 [Pirellulales bacterium]|nr:50S ribosomal protein L28 [Pirellulales bacterium]